MPKLMIPVKGFSWDLGRFTIDIYTFVKGRGSLELVLKSNDVIYLSHFMPERLIGLVSTVFNILPNVSASVHLHG